MPPPHPIDPQHWPRVKDLFAKAIDLPAGQRARFVAASERDPNIRNAVIAMIEADLDPASLLDGSAEQRFASLSPLDRMIGGTVGPYRVIERLGQGGMGTVYLAEHHELGHRVALKVIRAGMNSAAIVRRFEQERQIVASLAHPNVARVFDGGLTADDLPWFSMELVTGEPIDRYCRERHLPLADRLALFASVCDAVQYAHARLVVHRDLKPSNILVGSDGVAKLLDFGIAKLLSDDRPETTDLTQTGVRPMSPAHAAPEQIRGEPVTTATDVYALGVVLYEMIAGTRPYGDDLSGHSLEQAILTITPPRPNVSSDVDNIVMMALRKEPDRRYPSAGAFAEDVRRFISGHPVSATRDSATYRIRKFAGRNRAAVAATVAGVLITSASVGWYTVKLREERELAQREAQKAEQVSAFLQGIFTAPDPMGLNRNAAARLNRTAGQLLADAVGRIDTALGAQPAVRASLLSVLGSTYRSLGDYKQAVALLERADTALARSNDADPHLQAQVSNALGSAYWELGDLKRAAVAQQRAYELMLSISNPNGLAVAVAANDLAVLYWQMGEPAVAEPLLAKALTVFRRSKTADDPVLATAIANEAGILRELGRIDESERLYREVIASKKRALGADHPSVANTLSQLTTLLLEDRGDAKGAELLSREGLAIRQKALGERHPYVAISLNELAGALRADGRLDEAEATFRQALTLRREVLTAGHPHIAYSLTGLAAVLTERDRPAEAEPLLVEAVAIRRTALPADHWLLGDTEARLGSCLVLLGRNGEGIALLERGHAAIEAKLGTGDRRTRESRARLDSARATVAGSRNHVR